jgi:hypothetical protein
MSWGCWFPVLKVRGLIPTPSTSSRFFSDFTLIQKKKEIWVWGFLFFWLFYVSKTRPETY